MMKRRSLLWKIIFPYLIFMSLVLVGVGWYGSHALTRFFVQETTQDLVIRTRLVVQNLPHFTNLTPRQRHELCQVISAETTTRVTLIGREGTVWGDSHEQPSAMDNHGDRPEILAARENGVGTAIRYSFTRELDMLYCAQAIQDSEGRPQGYLRLAVPMENLAGALSSTRNSLLLGGLAFFFVVVIFTILIGQRISRILENITRGTQRWARGNLEHRIWVPDEKEFGKLVQTLNAMAGELENSLSQIQRQHNQQRAILTSMTEGVIAINPEYEILSVNETARRMFGLSQTDVVGKPLESAIRNAQIQDFFHDIIHSQKPLEQEMVILDQNRYLHMHGTPLLSDESQRIGALVVLNDISQLKKLETMRQDFVANVSHELKTPITSITGFIETLKEGALQDETNARRFLTIISEQAERLNTIIDDLLTLSSIEREQDRHRLNIQAERVRPVLESVMADYRHLAESKGVPLRLKCPPGLTAVINADLIRQAVTNLLDNALKYAGTEKGIEISAEQSEDTFILSVTDFGSGIPEAHHDRLFERFYRVDKGRSRKLGGTGLGLAIVKHIALAHHGQVFVESQPEAGSRFTIQIPI
ncbi:MAG: PAS domain-containing protein [Candidatus Marinimicrobia bacterium]|nr:PAS domain-containing protein [Candidatus Neomarinimicrobiota bacterium]MCF7840602.1 PAS domain-containing protein [Candidatus Neomarinimicrobiota bacterium]MCF7903414.1 PAS domain-containing protein [Candidatus Neomarinimicrobiota bacterium]